MNFSVTQRSKSWKVLNDCDLESYGKVVGTHLTESINTLGLAGTSGFTQVETVCSVLGAWAEEPVARFDHRHSYTANDGLPVEFSFAFGRTTAGARVLFEPQALSDDVLSGQREGRAFVERLERSLGVDVDRFRAVEDLFLGEHASPPLFSMLHAAALTQQGRVPLFKTYFNPAALDAPPVEVVGEAMARLGLARQWAALRGHLGASDLGSPGQEVALFALDHGADPEARVKIYLRHSGCGPGEIERVAAIARGHRLGLFSRFLEETSDLPVADWSKAPMTCLAYRGSRPVASSVTLYCPLEPNLAHDGLAEQRVLSLLAESRIDTAPCQALLDMVCGTDRSQSRRLSWFGYKNPDDPVVTVYAGLSGVPGPGTVL